MALINWDESLNVNVGEIDGQHQKLVQMINQLHDAMRQGRNKDVLGKIIDGLFEYAGTHFRTEEKYFDQFKYPGTEIHKKEHSDFVRKVAEFKKEFDSGKVGVSMEVMNFLSTWLKNHIKGSDKKYAPFLNEKGLK